MDQWSRAWKTPPVSSQFKFPPRGDVFDLLLLAGVDINVGDSETVTIFAKDQSSFDLAKMLVHNVAHGFLTDSDFEVRVTQVLDYGVYAVITAFPSQTVFIHSSELNNSKTAGVKVDDVFLARGLGYERLGKPAFTRRRLIQQGDSDIVDSPSSEEKKSPRPPKEKKKKE